MSALDSRKFSTARLPSYAGYEDQPVIDHRFPFHRVEAPRFDQLCGRIVHTRPYAPRYLLWSFNSRQTPFFPGTSAEVVSLRPDDEVSHRRFDGHLGRFDPTVSPQYLSEKVWRGFILRPTIGFAKRETLPEFERIYKVWDSAISRLKPKYVEAMVKRAELLATAINARARLQNSFTNYWDSRPTLPTVDQVRSLGNCSTYEEAVDLCAEVQRGMKEQSAWLEFVERLRENWVSAKARLKTEGVLPAHDDFIGVWINGNREDDTLWLMSHGVPCFIIHELAPLDAWVWSTSRDTRKSWVVGTEADLLRKTEYDSIALANGSVAAPFVAPRPHPAVPSLGGTEFTASPIALGWISDQTGYTSHRGPSTSCQVPDREVTPVADPEEWPPLCPTLAAPEPLAVCLYEGRVAWIKPPPVHSTRNQKGGWTKFLDDGEGHFVKITSTNDVDSDDEGHVIYDRHLRRELYCKGPALTGRCLACLATPSVSSITGL
ncbi:hypothetical protein FPV67DRAFT_1665935 [Lyophyllum atratum]|nr:hypothetical protein FPV67DRAFT_1665935 [Lyophyllum atratum]